MGAEGISCSTSCVVNSNTTSRTDPVRPTQVPFWQRVAGMPATMLGYVIRRPGRVLLGVLLVAGLTVGALLVVGYTQFHSHLSAARVAVGKWHNSEAVRHLAVCRDLRPDHPEVLLLAARVARRTGEWSGAEALLGHYEAVHGQTDDFVFEQLLHRASRGDTDGSVLALQARIRKGGDEARLAREALVLGLVVQFRFREARAVLADWLTDAPDDPLAVLLDAKLLVEEQSSDRAVAAFRRALELDPELDDARLDLARLLVSRRHGAEAEQALAPLRTRLPDHPEVQVLWAKALALQGRIDEARAALDECLATFPNHPDALTERGTIALLDGNETAAADYLRRAVQRDPANRTARTQLALVLGRLGRTAEAETEHAAIRQLDEDSERITALVRGALRANPNDPAIQHQIGFIALRSGQTQEALRWFNSALRANPDYLPTHRALAVLYQELENPILAAKHRAIAQRLTAQQGKQ